MGLWRPTSPVNLNPDLRLHFDHSMKLAFQLLTVAGDGKGVNGARQNSVPRRAALPMARFQGITSDNRPLRRHVSA